MMNPPESIPKLKKFSVTFEITEGKSNGQILSFDNISSSIVSSISSGALADHSSLSESSESLPHLTTVHSSTSTSSSGLSASRTAKLPTKPCLCCNVLNYIKLHCLCGQGTLLFVRDVSSSKEGVDAKDCARLPEVYSDMDLTDPVVGDGDLASSSANNVSSTGETQESQPFPKIRLSIRRECDVSSHVLKDPDEEIEDVPAWWVLPKWEYMLSHPEELPGYRRPPMIPSHFRVDPRSRFLRLLWVKRTVDAYDYGNDPPQGLSEIYHDPRIEPLLPIEIVSLLNRFSDNEVNNMMKQFEESCQTARMKAAEDGIDIPEFVKESPFNPDDQGGEAACEISDVNSTSTQDAPNQEPPDYFFEDAMMEEWPGPQPSTSTSDPQWPGPHPSTSTSNPRFAAPQPFSSNADSNPVIFYDEEQYEGFSEAYEQANVPVSSSQMETCEQTDAPISSSQPGYCLIYAKYHSWYYPGWIQCSVEDWDNATEPMTVHFYDNSPEMDLPPHLIFPLQRLPAGAGCQWQVENNIYDDVYYMSYTPSFHESVPSAIVQILSGDSPVKEVSFSSTALSPKNASQIRSALKSAFYPSNSSVNFTELTTGSILSYVPRRRAAALSEQKWTKKPKKVSLKKKGAPSSSSAEAGHSAPKLQKTGIIVPSSTEDSTTSPEAGHSAPKRQKTETIVPSSTADITTSPEVNVAGPSKPDTSRPTSNKTLQKNAFVTDSETDTDTSHRISRWSHCVGYGLQMEKCVLSEKKKSYTQLKNRAKRQRKTKIFASQHFVLTNGPLRTFGKSRKRVVDSESESTDYDNYYTSPVEFNVIELQQAIECGGGRIYPDFVDIPEGIRKNPGHDLILVSCHPASTPNYIYAVSLGCTIVRHDTILDCANQNLSLRDALRSGSAFLLSPGWCEQKKTWTPPRASMAKPLDGLQFLIALSLDRGSKHFWWSVLRHLGGKPIIIEEAHQHIARVDHSVKAIVADPEITSHLALQAQDQQIPVVTTAWIIQATITGSIPPFSPYRVTVKDSSS